MDMNVSKCELAYELTYNEVYRAAQFYTFFVSFLAVFALLYFIFKKLWYSAFHVNLKVLLISYFGMLMAFSFSVTVTFGHHSLQPFFAISKCDLILNQFIFKWLHILSLFTMTTPMLLQVAISIERIVAVIMVHRYERVRIGIGPLLVGLVLLLDLTIVYIVYKNETFEETFISFILIPSTSAKQMNSFFWFLLYTDIVNFLVNCILLQVTSCLKKRYLKLGSLSLRYEIEEILFSTKFTLSFTFLHLLTVGWYLSSILAVRTLGQQFFNGYINYTTARGVFMSVPTYSLLVVFASLNFLKRYNRARVEKTQKSVLLKYSGPEGAENHYEAINNAWNMVSISGKHLKEPILKKSKR